MKYLIILITIFFLFSCESEKDPCDIEYQLNEPGGFGRNEVTFMIDDSVLWHSSQLVRGGGSSFGGIGSSTTKFLIIQEMLKDDDGKSIKDSLGEPIYLDDYVVQLETQNSFNCKNDFFDNVNLRLIFRHFNETNPTIEEIDIYTTSGFINSRNDMYKKDMYRKDMLSNNSLKTINSKVYLNRKDSIIYGTFSGELYGRKEVNGEYIYDTLKITNGVFDYRYKAENFFGEIK